MKNIIRSILAATLCSAFIQAHAQPGPPAGAMGGPPPGPRFVGSMIKLFGDNSSFSAGRMPMTVPGKIFVLDGKSRFEMNMAEMKSSAIPPQAVEQMKAMGMNEMVNISNPEEKITYLVYPGLQAFAQVTMQDPEAAKTAADFKIETTELGKETVNGFDCVKNKAVVTDNAGKQFEYTVWNATDLKDFPVKLETTNQGRNMTMVFKDVKLSKPDKALFAPPADYKKYDSMMAMMQQEMMKRMGGMGAAPPPP
jgi:hypothetical protein